MADNFHKLGILLAAKKMSTDYDKCRAAAGNVEMEHFSEEWMNSNIDGPKDYTDEVFRNFLMSRK